MEKDLAGYLADNMYNIMAIDHGNGAVKTPYSEFRCGISTMPTKPLFAEHYVRYKGMYYTLTEDVPPYRKDKTRSEDLLITTLLALGMDAEAGLVDLTKPIRLAVGLPPTHLQALAPSMQKYFKQRLKDPDETGKAGCSFSYKGKRHRVVMQSCFVLPQCSSAALPYLYRTAGLTNDLLEKGYTSYIFVDIGAQTVDVNYVTNAHDPSRIGIDPSRSGTTELGALVMEEHIRDKVNAETGLFVSNRDIEDVLMERSCPLTSTAISLPGAQMAIRLIENGYRDHVGRILHYVRTKNANWATAPWILLGHASVLFEKGIGESPECPPMRSLIRDPKANAIGYRVYTQSLLAQQGKKPCR